MNLLLVFFFISGATFAASTPIEEAKVSIRTLIQPLIGQNSKKPKGTEKFRVDACEKKKINWMDVLLQKEEAEMEFIFKEGCDLQGKVKPKVLSPFEANFDLKNLQSYKKVETENTISADLQTKPILKLEMRKGTLSGKHIVKFEADYRVRINPTARKAVNENLGGELRISEIDGKKVNIKEFILVK